MGAGYSATGGTPTTTVGYAYDPAGNRVRRDQTVNGVSATERFAYDGADAWADLDTGNAVTSRRVFGAGADDVLARRDAGGAVTWYASDRLGSVRATFDSACNTTSTRGYTGYGGITGATGQTDRYAFAGREWDATLGLSYNRARLYDPLNGRWLSEDPIGFGGGDANLFRYVGNQPTGFIDPSGLKAWTEVACADPGSSGAGASASNDSPWSPDGVMAIIAAHDPLAAVFLNEKAARLNQSGVGAWLYGRWRAELSAKPSSDGRPSFTIPAHYTNEEAAAYILGELATGFTPWTDGAFSYDYGRFLREIYDTDFQSRAQAAKNLTAQSARTVSDGVNLVGTVYGLPAGVGFAATVIELSEGDIDAMSATQIALMLTKAGRTLKAGEGVVLKQGGKVRTLGPIPLQMVQDEMDRLCFTPDTLVAEVRP